MIHPSIIPYKDIGQLKELTKGKKTVLVGGCFDLIHYGHVSFLRQAKAAGEILIVALEPDEFIRKKKNKKEVHTQLQRAHILTELRSVDYVLLLPLFSANRDYEDMINFIHPNVIALTKGDKHLMYKKQQAEAVGATVVEIDLLVDFSSSKLITYAPFLSD